MSPGRPGQIVRVAYVLVVASLAAIGDTRSAAPLLAAAALCLPCGVAALVGVYFIFAILVGAAHAFGLQVTTNNGFGPLWFVVIDEVAVTVLFALAATFNSIIIGDFVRQVRLRLRLRPRR